MFLCYTTLQRNNMDKAKYVNIPFTDEYLINKNGVVWSVKREMAVKEYTNAAGYKYVVLYIKGKRTQWALHRLLMVTFKPIEHWDILTVDHLDGNPANNNLDNLEWVTQAENTRRAHAARRDRVSIYRTPVTVYTLTKKQEVTYPTPRAAAKALQCDIRTVLAHLNGRFGSVYEDGTMIKWATDPREFPEIEDIEQAKAERRRQRVVVAKNHLTAEITKYPTLREFCHANQLSEGVASTFINNRNGIFWFGVEAHYEIEHKSFTTPSRIDLFRYSFGSPYSRPVICINGLENKAMIVPSNRDAAEMFHVATSTMSYWSTKGWGGANGWIFNTLDNTPDDVLVQWFKIDGVANSGQRQINN